MNPDRAAQHAGPEHQTTNLGSDVRVLSCAPVISRAYSVRGLSSGSQIRPWEAHGKHVARMRGPRNSAFKAAGEVPFRLYRHPVGLLADPCGPGSINSVKNNAGHALPKGASERSGSTGQEKGASSRERRPNKPETGAWLPPRCRSGPPRSPSPFGSAYGVPVHVGWLMTTNIAPAQTKDVLDRTRPIRKFPLLQGTW